MPSICNLLGEFVLNNSGEDVRTTDLASSGKIIGLYFSAHWCPPCREFTPVLIEWYNNFKQTEKGKPLEIIFISSDKDEATFTEYFKEMPWHALPYGERDRKGKITKKYKTQNIPVLLFIDAKTSKVITGDGRVCIMEDPEGSNFPWHPKSLSSLLNGPLITKSGTVESEQHLKGKVKGFYFSAHWCPPCRGFTPTLIDVYNNLKEKEKPFEVIFLSSDRSEQSFEDYYETMPWAALPLGDKRISKLQKHFGVQGIPMFIIVDENNQLITSNGRAVLQKDPTGSEYPWPPKPLNEICNSTSDYINEGTCLIYFTDGEEEQITKAKEVLTDSATKYATEYKDSEDTEKEIPEIYFLYEGTDDEGEGVCETISNIANLEERIPLLVMLDVPEQRCYTHPEGEITKEVIEKLIQDFKSGTLPFKALK